VDLNDAVTLSLLPRAWRLRQPLDEGGTNEFALTLTALAACARAGAPTDHIFERLLTVLDPGCEPGTALRALRSRSARLLDRARTEGIDVHPFGSACYPAPLARIDDPPPVLWMRGARYPSDSPAVAIVGSRAASPYALEVAASLGSELAARGVLVVSGLARGVDSAAHRGALEAAGLTAAVLGCGPDRVYPAEHRQLAAAIAESGVLVTEFPPGAPPLPHHFPRRNRIISGLALAVVVVEASERSGSLITAACALEQGREVMAVPGNVLGGRNRGSHALLKDGAKIVESSDDILEELGIAPGGRAEAHAAAQDDVLLRVMAPGDAVDLDAIVEHSGLDPRIVLARLAELELRGAIRRAEGGRFVRERATCYRCRGPERQAGTLHAALENGYRDSAERAGGAVARGPRREA
jgi:DNA processing protein